MYRFILFLTFSFISFGAFTQLTVKDLKDSKTYLLHPDDLKWNKKLVPFNNIIVIDNRFDTTKLGYKKESRKYEKLNLENGLAGTMQQMIHSTLQANMDASSNSSLYIFVKHLWIQPTTELEFAKQKLYDAGMDNDTSYVSCKATLESFILKDDLFYPLHRIDSSFLIEGKMDEKSNYIVSLPFQLLINKLNEIDLSRNRKPVDYKTVIRHYKDRFSSPRMQTDTMVRGVYKTYKDFLSNNISNPSFIIKYQKLGRHRFILDEEEQELLHNIWGYYDGEKLFIKLGTSFYELIRENNSFEFVGSKNLIRFNNTQGVYVPAPHPGFLVGGAVLDEVSKIKNIKAKNIRPLQLNMETGEPY